MQKTGLQQFIISALFTLIVITFWFSDSRLPETVGAPPIMRNLQHQYDPDWPEINYILRHKCFCCHNNHSKQSNLSNYSELMKAVDEEGKKLIVPGFPDQSPFVECIDWNSEELVDSKLNEEPSMPLDSKEWLTTGQIKKVKRWIKNGALEFRLPGTCNIKPLTELDFPSAKECKTCHPKQYEEWSRSMHAYAQHSPVMEAFAQTLQEKTGGTLGTFCARCHTPIGTALGENGVIRNVHRSRISREGVTCVVCHRISKPYYKSNVRMNIEPGKRELACIYGPFENDAHSKMNGHPSKKQNYLKDSAFCGTCHDVTTPRGVRLEEAFSEWQNSPAAKQGVTCQNCHMGPIQGIPIKDCERPRGYAAVVPGLDPTLLPLRHLSDHTFAGPDYSLLPDTEFPHKLDWMYETDYKDQENLTNHQIKTLKQIRLINRRQLEIANNKRYELLKNGARIHVHVPKQAEAGKKIKVRVDVESTTAGHNFPTGFSAERQLWVEITLCDPAGRPVFQSGNLDSNMDLRDEHSQQVEHGMIRRDKYLMNFQNKFVGQTHRGTDRSLLLPVNRHLMPLNVLRPSSEIPASFGRRSTFRIAKASIPPLATISKKYPMRLPKIAGVYCLKVRLNFRHLPPGVLDGLGIPHLKNLLEIVVIDQFETDIRVTR